jgi:hypothetical protein
MSIFLDISTQYALADATFGKAEQQAFDSNDDAAFDLASKQRRHNDQAYFLYLFTRFENEINQATQRLLASRVIGQPWPERRIWEAWSRIEIKEIHFLSKVEVLTDKSRIDYREVKKFYDARNRLAHGGELEDQFVVPAVAQQMHDITSNFAVT